MGGVKGCKVNNIADTSGPSLVAVLIFLGSLFFLTRDRTPAFGEIQKAPAGIRVVDHRGFTRIVFPHEHPEKISVEPDLNRRRLIVRFPETTNEVTTLGAFENHHLIRRIEILPERGKGLLVEVVLANQFIDWVSDLAKAPVTPGFTAEVGDLNPTEASPPFRAPDTSFRRENRSDMAKDLGVAEGDEVAENPWRPRVRDIFYKMGDLKRARDEYGRVLSESSDFSYYPPDSLFSAGQSFLKNQDFQRGREILFRALNLDPGSGKGKATMEAIAQSYPEDLDEEALRVNLLLCESFGKNDSNGMELVRLADMRPSHPGLKWSLFFVERYLHTVDVYQDFPDHSQDMNLASVEIKEE